MLKPKIFTSFLLRRELKLLGADRQQGSGGRGAPGAKGSTFSILSGRGSAIVDERTNTIILTDIAEKD